MGTGHVSHHRTSALYDHLDHSFIVFKNVQLRFTLRRSCVCGDVFFLDLTSDQHSGYFSNLMLDMRKQFSATSQALVHFVTAFASLFTDQRMSGLPIRAT